MGREFWRNYVDEDLKDLVEILEQTHKSRLDKIRIDILKGKVNEKLLQDVTKVINKRSFKYMLSDQLSLAKRHGYFVSVLMVDIDNFKRYNQMYGHPEGDEALKEVARTLKRNVRKEDLVGRYGGEEFIISFITKFSKIEYREHLDLAMKVADRIVKSVEDKCYDSRSKLRNKGVTISIGGATYHPNDEITSNTIDGLIKRADERLYKAKENEKNRAVFY